MLKEEKPSGIMAWLWQEVAREFPFSKAIIQRIPKSLSLWFPENVTISLAVIRSWNCSRLWVFSPLC